MMKSSMNEVERKAADDVPVVSEGGRSPSALSPGQVGRAQAAARPGPLAPGQVGRAQAAARPGPLAPGQRWSAARKREVVLRLLHGEPAELLSRELGLPIVKLDQWRRKAGAALEGALKEREANPADSELAAALQRIGELTMEAELLRARIGRPGPLARRRSR